MFMSQKTYSEQLKYITDNYPGAEVEMLMGERKFKVTYQGDSYTARTMDTLIRVLDNRHG